MKRWLLARRRNRAIACTALFFAIILATGWLFGLYLSWMDPVLSTLLGVIVGGVTGLACIWLYQELGDAARRQRDRVEVVTDDTAWEEYERWMGYRE